MIVRILKGATIGAVAGALGTLAMDVLWYSRYRRGGGESPPLEWEFGGVKSWDDVSAPGQVGHKALSLVIADPPDSWAQTTQNVVHWSTGIGWAKIYGMSCATTDRAPWWGGVALAPAAWLSSYVLLPPLKIYRPIWEYDSTTLAKDASAHLLYGMVTSVSYALLSRAFDGQQHDG